MRRRVAVTGLGFVTPLGTDVPTTWHALVAGTSGAGPITRFDPARLPVRFACEVKGFDPARYMDKKEIRRFDLFAQFAMAAATEALTDAGIPDLNGVDATRTGQRQDSFDPSGILNDLPGGGGPPENTLIPTIYEPEDE